VASGARPDLGVPGPAAGREDPIGDSSWEIDVDPTDDPSVHDVAVVYLLKG
jgi:hypothetical protein